MRMPGSIRFEMEAVTLRVELDAALSFGVLQTIIEVRTIPVLASG